MRYLCIPHVWKLTIAELLDVHKVVCGLALKESVLSDNLPVKVGAGERVSIIYKRKVELLHLLAGFFHKQAGYKVLQERAGSGCNVAAERLRFSGLLSPHGESTVIGIHSDNCARVRAANVTVSDCKPFVMIVKRDHAQATRPDWVSFFFLQRPSSLSFLLFGHKPYEGNAGDFHPAFDNHNGEAKRCRVCDGLVV